MRPRILATVVALVLASAVLLGAVAMVAQSEGGHTGPPLQPGAGYDLSWHVVAGGGGQVQAGDYILGGTAGQPVAGLVQNSEYDLCAGFWCLEQARAGYRVYLPLVLRVYAP